MSRNNLKKDKLKSLSENIEFAAAKEKLISFNFKYYDHSENSGQDFNDWSEDGILVDFNEKLVSLSNNEIEKLKRDRILEIYDDYPEDSCFPCPKSLIGMNVSWARLRLTGQRRIIGFIVNIDNKNDVFYFVFLDKNHEFAPSYFKKKKKR